MGLFKFRKELIEELLRNNNDVVLLLPYGDYTEKMISMGCQYKEVKISPHSTNPLKDLLLLKSYKKTIKMMKPDLVLTYTIKPNVYGGIACSMLRVPYISNITGLGSSIENQGFLQKISLFLYRISLKKASMVFFQNSKMRKLVF